MQNIDRSQARLRSILGARIVFANGNSSMDCLIRDISPAGARLELSSAATIPERFGLFIPQKGKTFEVAIKWRRGDEIGVVFETGQEVSAPQTQEKGLTQRVRELEAEIVALKQALAEMRREIADQTRQAGRA